MSIGLAVFLVGLMACATAWWISYEVLRQMRLMITDCCNTVLAVVATVRGSE